MQQQTTPIEIISKGLGARSLCLEPHKARGAGILEATHPPPPLLAALPATASQVYTHTHTELPRVAEIGRGRP